MLLYWPSHITNGQIENSKPVETAATQSHGSKSCKLGYDSQAAEVDTTLRMSWRAWFLNRARFV